MADSLRSIDEIRTKINTTIKFHERERYAAQIGKLYRNSPDEFKKLINDLCKPEPGDIPTVTVKPEKASSETDEKSEETDDEDKLVKILPSTSSNVPKKYHIQYAGLMAAVSSNVCTDLLEKEITESQSVMFKKFIIVNYVKQQQKFCPYTVYNPTTKQNQNPCTKLQCGCAQTISVNLSAFCAETNHQIIAEKWSKEGIGPYGD